jgi:uncharacterized membrane protein YhhN
MTWLLALSGLCAIVNWWAVERRQRGWVVVTKPAVMVFLIVWLAGVSGDITWLMAGLTLSLVGDVLLLGGLRFFKPGLLAFLAAHICYVLYFKPLIPVGAFFPAGVIAFFLLGLGIWFGRRVYRGLRQTGRIHLFRAVAGYMLAISLMVLAAALRGFDPDWSAAAALCALVGALLFFASDLMNAHRRFVAHFAHEELAVMVTYHLGQILLAVSAVLNMTGTGV